MVLEIEILSPAWLFDTWKAYHANFIVTKSNAYKETFKEKDFKRLSSPFLTQASIRVRVEKLERLLLSFIKKAEVPE